MDEAGRPWNEKGPKPLLLLGFQAFTEFLRIYVWWPVAESNHGHADFQSLKNAVFPEFIGVDRNPI